MKKFFVVIGALSYVLFGKVCICLNKIHKAFITGYYTYGMKSVGKGVSIECPVSKIYGRAYISIGDYTVIGKGAVITAWDANKTPTLSVGNHVALGDDCHITTSNCIIIGDGTLTGNKVTITDNSHGLFCEEDIKKKPLYRNIVSKGPVIIGENVWIGDKVTVCSGVTIGDSSIVGANSVVTHDVPSYSLVAGVPAKVIKKLTIDEVK